MGRERTHIHAMKKASDISRTITNRRDLMKGLVGSVLTASIAGCGSTENNVSETTQNGSSIDRATSIISTTIEEGGLEYYIVDHSVEEINPDIYISLTTDAVTSREMATMLGYVVGAYAATIGEIDINADAVGDIYTDDRLIGEWYCESQWAKQYYRGDISAERLLRKVAGTIKIDKMDISDV